MKRNADRFFGHHLIQHNGDPYMRRIWFGRLRLHIFYRGDTDPDCHDHPWDFWTFPLTPYVEEVLGKEVTYETVERNVHINEEDFIEHSTRLPIVTYEKRYQVVPAWRLSFRPATHCHRVLGRFEGYAWNHYSWELEQGLTAKQVARNVYLEPQHEPGRMVTLVWRSKAKRKWGFLKHRDGRWCWQYWRDYVLAGGKEGPCE